MKALVIDRKDQKYNLNKVSFFKDSDGNEYSISKDNSLQLLGLLLEALGMDICQRDDLLEQLEA